MWASKGNNDLVLSTLPCRAYFLGGPGSALRRLRPIRRAYDALAGHGVRVPREELDLVRAQ